MIELKNIKYAEHASEETHCYQANLYWDGKLTAEVKNDGHGGPDYHYIKNHDQWRALMDYIDSLPPREITFNGVTHQSPVTIDELCCEFMNGWLAKKDLQKLMRKRVIFTRKDKEGIFQTNCAPNALVRDKWAAEMAQEDDIDVVFNLLSLNEAAKRFQEAG